MEFDVYLHHNILLKI